MASQRRYHNENAEVYVEKYGRADVFQVPESMFLYRHLRPGPETLVVEVACGPAVSLTRHLSRVGGSLRYVGIDVSDRLIRFARQNAPVGRFLVADGRRLPLRAASADCIIVLGGLHNIPGLEGTFRGLLRILKPGGLLLIREPSPEAYRRRWAGDTGFERGIEPEALRALAAQEGASVVDFRRFNSELFHTVRRLLHTTRLYRLFEPFTLYWRVKTHLDEALSRTLGRRWRYFQGLDFCMVIRKAEGGV